MNVCRHGNLRQGSFGRAIAVASRIPPPEMAVEPLVLPVKHHSPMLSRHDALCIQSFTRCQARPPTLKPEGTGTQGCDWMDASLDLVHKRRTSATGQHFQADNGGSSRLQEDDSRDITEQSTSMSASRHAACCVGTRAGSLLVRCKIEDALPKAPASRSCAGMQHTPRFPTVRAYGNMPRSFRPIFLLRHINRLALASWADTVNG